MEAWDWSLVGKIVWVIFIIAWGVIRWRPNIRARRHPVKRSHRSMKDRVLQKRAAQYTGMINAVQLRLEKTGRNYVSSISLEPTSLGSEATSNGEWFTVQKLTSLRAPGNNLALVFGSKSNKYTPNTGEGLLKVDWVKIEQN